MAASKHMPPRLMSDAVVVKHMIADAHPYGDGEGHASVDAVVHRRRRAA